MSDSEPETDGAMATGTETVPEISHESGMNQDVNSYLLRLLECPVCLNYMKIPISQCHNGHCVCANCIPQLQHCPVCRENIDGTTSRNLLAEQMAERCLFPCKNTEQGCNKILKNTDLEEHGTLCPYRVYDCLVMKQECGWTGRHNELYDHVVQHHDGKAWNIELINFTCGENFGSTYFEEKGIISIHDELFCISVKWKDDQKKLFGVVQYIGERGNALKFKYRFEFCNESDKVIHQHITKQEVSNIEEIYRSGECLCFDTSLAKLFKKSNKLCFKLRIIKI